MVATSFTYFILQGPGLIYSDNSISVIAADENMWALFGLVVCSGLFIAYLWYQFKVANSEDQTNTFNEKRSASVADAIEAGQITLFGAMVEEINQSEKSSVTETSSLKNKDNVTLRLEVKIF